MILRGQLQRISHLAEYDLPRAARWLASLESHLQGSVDVQPPMPVPGDGDGEAAASRGRGGTDLPAEEEDP